MNPRLFQLSEAAANELQAAYIHCQDPETKTRYQAVRLYGLDYPVERILDICVCSTRSLMRWCAAYQTHGISALCDHRRGGTRARLTAEQIEVVQQHLHRYTPAQLLGKDTGVGNGEFWTVPDVATLLQRDYGVTYQSATSYRTLLKKCALSYQRPAKQYKSHAESKVMAFEETLEKNSPIPRSMLPTR